MRTDKSGNVYLTGTTTGNLDGEHPNATWDAFLAKYDPSGKQLFVRQFAPVSVPKDAFSATRPILPFAIAIDPASGSVYVGGKTTGTMGGCQRSPLRGESTDGFISKFDADGRSLGNWQFGTSTSYGVHLTVLALDAQGHLYAGGWVSGNDLNGNPAVGVQDAFLIRFADGTGKVAFARRFGVPHHITSLNSITFSPSGYVYVGGHTDGIGTLFGQPLTGKGDGFLAKYDVDGNALFSKVIPYGGINEITIDNEGRLFATGGAYHALDSSNKQTGELDAFLSRFSLDGTNLWNTQLGAANAGTFPMGLAVNAQGQVFMAGYGGRLDQAQPNGTLFLAGYDIDGNRRFIRQIGPPPAASESTSWNYGVATDPSGNVFMIGTIRGGGLDNLPLIGKVDGFLLKFDKDGVKQ
jgi:hypothetical protein